MSEQINRKYKTLAKDTALFTISSFGSKILVFLLTPLYTSILAASEYGIADLITTTIHFIYPILTLAIADATLRYALDKSTDKQAVFGISTAFVLLSVGVLLLIRPLIGMIDSSLEQYWWIFVLNYFLFNIHNYFSNFVKALGRTALFSVQGLLHTATIITCNILFLVVWKLGLTGYLWSMIIGYTVPIALMFFAAKLHRYLFPFRIDWKLLVDMMKYCIPMVPTLLAWSINTSITKYMIIWMYDIGTSGVFSVAHKIPTIITTILSVFTQAWQISVISNHGSEDESRFYTTVYHGLDFVSVSGCMAVFLLCKWMAGFLFAKEFFVAWQYVPMLVLAAMFSSHAGFLAAAYRAAKKTKSLFVSVLVGAVINVVLNYILLKHIGVVGAAIGTAVSFFAVWLVRIIRIQRIVKVEVDVLQTVLCYALLVGSAIVVTYETPYCYAIIPVAYVLICVIKRKTIVSLLSGLMGFVKKRKA